MDERDHQRAHLLAVADWARRIHADLQPILDDQRRYVHFRPGSTGVAMVGLVPGRAQRGKSGVRDLAALARDFDDLFRTHCLDVDHGRPTPEKELQSFLIREGYANQRRLKPLNDATEDGVELVFVADELALPTDGGRIVCDLLALRVDGGCCVPVAIELKSRREMARLVEQVTSYAALVDQHASLFADIYSAVLGRDIAFTGECERWIVWPAAGGDRDPREAELGKEGLRVVGYVEDDGSYAFRVGDAPACSQGSSTGVPS